MFDKIQNPILVFTVITFVMLAAPALAERFRIPDIVLLLLAGALLGPNGLDIIERGPAVTMFGEIGLIYIMFSAGLEIDPRRFARTCGKSVSFGLLSFAIPQALGMVAGRWLLDLNWTQTVLLASMFASHTLLSYQIASRLGISRAEPVAVTVSGTIVCNTLSLLILAVIADSAAGNALGFVFWTRIALGMAALSAFAWLVIPRLTRWFMEKVPEAGGAQFLYVFMMFCSCAYLSRFAKLEPIIGAFLAGIAFNRLIPPQGVLMNRVQFAGNTLFIPFFLISTGMLVNASALLSSWRGAWTAAVMVLATIGAKFLAAWASGKAFGYGRDAIRVMFGLSVVQAAATLAAVLVGHRLGLFDDAILNGAIAMIIFTCPLGSWTVEKYGRRLAADASSQDGASQRDEFDTGRILVPVVKEASAARVMELAVLLRNPKSAQSTIHPITIARDDENADESFARAERLVARCLALAVAADTPVAPAARIDINPSDGISRAARELRCASTLVAWDDSPRYGGVMRNLLRACPSRLLFCRLPSPINTTARLLLLLPPLAGRRSDIDSLVRDAKQLGAQIGAELRVYFSSRANLELRDQIEAARPELKTSFIASPTLTQACRALEADLSDGDMALLALERKGSGHWAPVMEHIPEGLAARHASASIAAAYPELLREDPETMFHPLRRGGQAGMTLKELDFDPSAPIPPESALPRLCAAAFPDDDDARESALRQLLASASAYPVQITADSVLLHTHSDDIARPVLLIGNGSFMIPKDGLHSRLLLCLVSPKSRGAEQHLRNLSQIASKLASPEMSQALAANAPASAIAAIIGDG